jgi:ABC-2 type transport system permease protein
VNVTGMRTLLVKEITRFLRVPGQTILSPLISTTLYFLVFGYSLGGSVRLEEGLPYLLFIVPGLIFLGLANNAFLNSSSSIFITKIQGTVVDLLVAPLGPLEILVGFIGGAMVRGIAVGILTWVVAGFFTTFRVVHPLAAIGFLLLIAYTFATLGVLAALWAEKFEQINFFPTFVMLPLTFLGGVFYSVQRLPSPWRTVSLFNPMVYMADGMRFGVVGVADFSPWLGAGLLLGLAAVATAVAARALQTGYKLRQ